MNAADPGPKTPQERDALHRHYDRASALLRMAKPDFEAAGKSLYECVVGEPGNSIFIEAFLICYRRRFEDNGTGSAWKWFAPTSPWRTAVAANDPVQVIRCGLTLLQVNPWNQAVLASLADATAKVNAFDAADRYLQHALDACPESVDLLRQRALLQTHIGDFDLAARLWSRILEVDPSDTEAATERQFLVPNATSEDEAVIESLELQLQDDPSNAELALELVGRYEAAGNIIQAQAVIEKSLAASGKDLRLTGRAEELQLSHLRRRYHLARAYEKRDAADWAGQLAEQLNREIQNREIELLSQQAARESTDMNVRVRLAEMLQNAGNFSAAAKWWEEIRRTDGLRSLACLRAGECLSHMRQFERSLACFMTAIDANDGGAEVLQAALKHGAKLADATGRGELAKSFRRRLVGK